MDKTNINALVQSIERSLHLIYKNIFSIKQNQFPPKFGLNFFKESRRTSPLCVRRRLRAIHLPWTARSHGGARQGVDGVPPSVRPTRANLDYDHGNMPYQMFSSAAVGVMNTMSVFRWLSGTCEEKMDPDKSVVFAYGGMPAHLDLAIHAPYVHSLCFPPRHSWKGFKLSGSDTKGRHLESGNLKMYV